MGKVYKYKTVEFWAERGRIMVVDTEKAADAKNDVWQCVTSVDPVEFYKRAVAVYTMHEDWPNERMEARQLLDNAREACLTALRQDENRDKLMQMRKRASRAMSEQYLSSKPRLILPPGAKEEQKWEFKKEPAKKVLVSGYELIPANKIENQQPRNA